MRGRREARRTRQGTYWCDRGIWRILDKGVWSKKGHRNTESLLFCKTHVKVHWSMELKGNYDRQTNQPSNPNTRQTDQPSNQRTDRRGQRVVKPPMWCNQTAYIYIYTYIKKNYKSLLCRFSSIKLLCAQKWIFLVSLTKNINFGTPKTFIYCS